MVDVAETSDMFARWFADRPMTAELVDLHTEEVIGVETVSLVPGVVFDTVQRVEYTLPDGADPTHCVPGTYLNGVFQGGVLESTSFSATGMFQLTWAEEGPDDLVWVHDMVDTEQVEPSAELVERASDYFASEPHD